MFFSLESGRRALLIAITLVFLSLSPTLASETILHNFTQSYTSGASPVGPLTLYGGQFYGVTKLGINGYGSIFKMTSTGMLTTLHEFAGSDGTYPETGLVFVGGNFYGTTYQGGASNGYGVAFRMTPSGAYTVLHTFTGYNYSNPSASDGSFPNRLKLASDGNLYGETGSGGLNNLGTVFMINPASGSYSILHSFNNTTDIGYAPSAALTEGLDGALYGIVLGISSNYNFSSGIYKLNKDGSGFAFVHGFSFNDLAGYSPTSDLLTANDGNIYGTCAQGGTNKLGTVYKLVTSTGSVTPLWAFDGFTGAYPGNTWDSTQLIQGSDGNLYGVTNEGGYYTHGTAFRLTLAGVCSVLTNFSDANSLGGQNSLVQSGASFYCTSVYGGVTSSPPGIIGYGAAMSINSAGTVKVIQSFHQRDCYGPEAGLVQIGTFFYGECYSGGLYGDGAIYKVDSAGHCSIIHHLSGSEGSNPVGGLLLARDGNLYGICASGGAYNLGTIFKVTTKGVLTAIHPFYYGEGNVPYGALIQGVYPDNNLYGVISQGGVANNGTIFCLDTGGKSFKIIHYFTGLDGLLPSCTLLPDGNGNLYGASPAGGANSDGTLWKVSTDGAAFTKLFDFDNTHGAGPLYSGQLVVLNGVLYGVAAYGGANGNGVIFQTNLSTNTTSIFHSFNDSLGEGQKPYSGLIYDASSGNFYGCCSAGGSNGYGTIYKINLSSGVLTVLHSFAGYNSGNPPTSDGSHPYTLTLGTDGFLYGTTISGGTSNNGTVFQQTTTP